MGNRVVKICTCCSAGLRPEQGDVFLAGDEGFGHSFCYVRPDPARVSSSKVHHSEETTTFRSISGAALGANTSTPLSTDLQKPSVPPISGAAAAFESSDSFQLMPLQPVPRFNGAGGVFPGPLSGISATERGFMSGPLERSFLSGPLDLNVYSGPLERSFSHGGVFAGGRRKKSVMKSLRRAISAAVARTSIVAPIKSGFKENSGVVLENSVSNPSRDLGPDVADSSSGGRNLQWAQGKAGEDRVHVVVSEEHGWLFVGIYDGFNGPDAPDYLLSNLYTAVHSELKGLLWDQPQKAFVAGNECCSISDQADHHPNSPIQNHDLSSSKPERKIRTKRRKRKYHPNGFHGVTKKWEENQKRWKEQLSREFGKENSFAAADHVAVQKALFRALKKTEDRFLEIADRMATENPELALMGSCVLVMLMKGEDVYLMNVGDSRGVLARRKDPEPWDLGKINEEESALPGVRQHCYGYSFSDDVEKYCSLSALQLTVDHSTSVEEEVERIKKEHPDDAFAVMNDRVKGSLKITRAFGAGFLKQPKWNNALLEMFQIDYVGNRPYLTCKPSLYHHRLGPKDQFLILSSDGLYQYFTNEEAVAEVEQFLLSCPEGDPAQHLVEEVLFRAAKKAGMDFHELLEIPHGDRRRYHDDVSIIVVSLEGRIWRSCV